MNGRILLLGLLIIAQIAVPLRMIQQRETVLHKGERFHFRTQPIDPADPFQGRYVWLRIKNDFVPLTQLATDEIDNQSQGYAIVSTDDQGFAQFTEWTQKRPNNPHYLKTRSIGHAETWDTASEQRIHQGLRIEIPFTRFYMDEAKAPLAEQLARNASRNEDCWVTVRIYKGKAVIEDVFAEGQSLRDLTTTANTD